jgi:thymidylate kinase
MSENQTRIEVDAENGLTLVPGDDELGDKIRQMSEEQVQQTMETMLVALRRAQFRVISGGAQ